MLHGIFPAIPTPFTPDGVSVAWDKIKPLCETLLSDGVHGVFACGTTGEGPLLAAEEKIRVIDIAMEAIAGRGRIIAQVGGGDLPGTLKTARHARQVKVDAVSLLQPWFFSYDEEAQFNYIARVAETLEDWPLYLYNLPQNTHTSLPPAVLERLLNTFENIRGIKESGSLENLETWNTFRSDRFQVMSGIDAQVCTSFKLGGYAVVASTANVQPRVFRNLYDAAMEKRWEEAEKQQAQISRFAELLNPPILIATIKESMRLKGIDAGFVRPPLRNLQPAEISDLKRKLQTIRVIP